MRGPINYKRDFIFLYFFLFISSFSFIALPFISSLSQERKRIYSNFVGALFWAGLILGMIIWIWMNLRFKKSTLKKGKMKNRIPGIVRFFSNPYAKCADLTFIIGVLFIFINFIYEFINDYFLIVIISSTLLTFHLHYILNGRLYNYLLNSSGGEQNVQ